MDKEGFKGADSTSKANNNRSTGSSTASSVWLLSSFAFLVMLLSLYLAFPPSLLAHHHHHQHSRAGIAVTSAGRGHLASSHSQMQVHTSNNGKQPSSPQQELLLQQAEAIRNWLDPDIMLQLQQLGIPTQLQVPEIQPLPQLQRGQNQARQLSTPCRDDGESTKLQPSTAGVGSADPAVPADSFNSAMAAIGASSRSKQPIQADLNTPDSRFSASLPDQQATSDTHPRFTGSFGSASEQPGHDRTGDSFVKSTSPIRSRPEEAEDGGDMQGSIPVHSSMRDGQGNRYSGQPEQVLVRAITGKSIFLDILSEQDSDKDMNYSDEDHDQDETSSGPIVAALAAAKEIGSRKSQVDFDQDTIRDQADRNRFKAESSSPSYPAGYYPTQSKKTEATTDELTCPGFDPSDGYGDSCPILAGNLHARLSQVVLIVITQVFISKTSVTHVRQRRCEPKL